jgi:hypothetical protein
MTTESWKVAGDIAISLGTIVSLVGLIVSYITLAQQIDASRRERSNANLLRMVDSFERLRKATRETWITVRDTLRKNPKTAQEVDEKTGSIQYLLKRAEQKEPMYAIEHKILRAELESLLVLNEACRLALRDEDHMLLVRTLLGSEVRFYQTHLANLGALRAREKDQILLPLLRSDALERVNVDEYFEPLAGRTMA